MTAEERAEYRLWAGLPAFRRRVAQAESVIDAALADGTRLYVAWSGGKDSTVLLHLVRKRHPDVPVLFIDSGAEFPDTLAFITEVERAWRLNLTIMEPAMSLLELYAWAGWWGSSDAPRGLRAGEITRILIRDPAARMRVEAGCEGAFLGLRAEESYARRLNARTRSPLYRTKEGIAHCTPLVWWTARDVWAYIVAYDVPWNPVYDKAWPGGREAIRVGAYAGSTISTLRNARWAFVQRHYPALWHTFCARFPGARGWT
jgi:phosphoadenosine phosphosulfate reductase